MKKIFSLIMVCGLLLISFTACGPKGEKAGEAGTSASSASITDMLEFLPQEAQGVFFVDAGKIMAVEAIDKAIREDDNYQKYLEFIEKTGIDPKKDVYAVAIAMMTSDEGKPDKGVGVVNLKYNQESLLQALKDKATEEEKELLEEDYNGITIYTMPEEKNEGCFAFLDAQHVSVGTPEGVKAVLDVKQGRRDNVTKNVDLSALLKKTNQTTMFWGAVILPPDAMNEAASGTPFLADLESVKSLTINFDYAAQNILAEIRVESSDPAKNKQIADMINGIKAFGAMAAAEKPEIGELLNAIEVIASEEFVKISASIPEELIKKLKADTETKEQ